MANVMTLDGYRGRRSFRGFGGVKKTCAKVKAVRIKRGKKTKAGFACVEWGPGGGTNPWAKAAAAGAKTYTAKTDFFNRNGLLVSHAEHLAQKAGKKAGKSTAKSRPSAFEPTFFYSTPQEQVQFERMRRRAEAAGRRGAAPTAAPRGPTDQELLRADIKTLTPEQRRRVFEIRHDLNKKIQEAKAQAGVSGFNYYGFGRRHGGKKTMSRRRRGWRGLGIALQPPKPETNTQYAVGGAVGFGLGFVAARFLTFLPGIVQTVLPFAVGGVAYYTGRQKLGLGAIGGGAAHLAASKFGLLPGAADAAAATAGWGAYIADVKGVGAIVADAMNGVSALGSGASVSGMGTFGNPASALEVSGQFNGPFGPTFGMRGVI